MNDLTLRTLLLLALLSGCDGRSIVGATPVGGGADASGMDVGRSDVSCVAGQRACGDHCVDPLIDPAHCGNCETACSAGQTCVAGACELRCPGTEAACMGQCRDLETDRANCGACGRMCLAGQVCSLRRCATSCDASLTTCSLNGDGAVVNYCADTRTDGRNCGRCGAVCQPGNACVDGACQLSCGGAQRACAGTCRDLQTDNANCGACGNVCPPGNTCALGACAVSCGAGLTECGGTCVNLQTDNASCGACGTACAAGSVCSAGRCGATCAATLRTCGAAPMTSCADTAIDPRNCGACGQACALPNTMTQGCTAGACVVVRCAGGRGDCDGEAPNGCETDITSNPAHCGGCGRACLLAHATPACAAGACAVAACDTGFTDCDHVASNGCEADTRTDNANCGGCGRACGAGQVCSGGVCGATCASPLATCGASTATYCANTAIDPTNCGACGAVCSLPHVTTYGCAGGSCAPARCDAGFGDCDRLGTNGCETDLAASAANCGACGRVCALPNATATCAVGACTVATCAAGFADCNMNPADGCEVDTRTNNASCGACGTACPVGRVCSGGACAATCAAPLATCGAATAAFCASTAIDPTNCGACGTVCALPGVAANGCAAGACTALRCNPGFGDCNGTATDGCETNLQTSGASCGACGRACVLPHASAICTGGACGVASCTMGFADCDHDPSNGCEVDTRTDNTSCGACGTTCAAGQVCSGGSCGTTCASPLRTCGTGGMAFCADTGIDPTNCGACGTVCALTNVAAHACAAGACAILRCAGGFGDCDGTAANGCETDLGTSATSCGACGRTCTLPNATATCALGACGVASCATGFADCDHDPVNGCEVDTRTNNASCGACGRSCAAGQVCSGGACGATCAAPLRACGAGTSTFCTNTAIDPANCGGCATACSLAHVAAHGCSASACTVVRCSGGYGDCDGDPANGCETNLNASAASCGACGRACALSNAVSACSAGACTITSCAPGFADCNANPLDGCEVDTRSDNASCGACGTSCAAGQVCSAGACGATCASPLSTCGTAPATFCVNTSIDPANCGGCGTICALPGVAANGCAAGACSVVRCAAGFADCDGTASNGCETNIQTSGASCGACGRTCALSHATSMCTAGVCALVACAAGFSDCNANPSDGCEIDTRTDNASCGACGTGCAAGRVCSGGACSATCASPLRTCGSGPSAFCADTTSDPVNCGGCGTVCALPHVVANGCAASACSVVRCGGGFGDCNGTASDGCEADLNGSTANCGACGRACALPNATAACTAGVCAVATCATGFLDCDANPANGCEVDTRSDNTNCGACGTACPAGRVCSGGTCGTTCAPPLATCGSGSSGHCANTSIDPMNCGGCASVCALLNVAANGCAAGACTVVRCAAGYSDCDGSAANGCETSTGASLTNCGACGRVCALPNATATCTTGTCAIAACATGFADCDLNPADGCEVGIRSDNANCGACGAACAAGRVCSGGSCGSACVSPLRTCGTAPATFCADTTIDPFNCGACGAVCGLPNVAADGCSASACSIIRCTSGFGDCDSLTSNGCETSTQTSATNCGACGRSCVLPNASSTCTAGTCAIAACNTGFGNCDGLAADGCEVATGSDNANCGACGRVCGGGSICSGGVCGVTCLSPQVNCSGTCATLASDPAHCGSCTTVCSAPAFSSAYCTGGTCGFACFPGYSNCDGLASNGCEVYTNASVTNCGACGNACTLSNASAVCSAGACAIAACVTGFASCDGLATNGCEVDTRTSSANCGGCGMACPSGQFCSSGVCACSGGLRAVGAACVSPSALPRLITPMSLGNVTQRRPTFHWVLPPVFDSAFVELCRDRACTSPIETLTVSGSSARPTADLPAGRVAFWRVRGRVGPARDTLTSPTWLVHVPHNSASTAVDTSFNPHLDVNGDGYDDLVIGSPRASPLEGSQAGVASVFLGSASGIATTPSRIFEGGAAYYQLGYAVASAGDVNGDGFGDLLVSEHRANGTGGSYVGAVRVYHGSAAGISGTPATILQGVAGFEFFGQALASAGDVNGDGYADVVIGRGDASSVSVYLGSASGIVATAATTIVAGFYDGNFGNSVASAGDINGDGYSDIVIGADQARPGGGFDMFGEVNVFHGSASGIPATATLVLSGDAATSGMGHSVASAGDINGDGFADVVAGTTNEAAAVFTGSSSGLVASARRVVTGSTSSGNSGCFGCSVASAGDVNGDGFDDIVVGSQSANLGFQMYVGAATVLNGGGGGLSGYFLVLPGVAAYDSFGAAVAGAGDIDGDGYSDVVVGAPNASGGAGTASLFRGDVFGIARSPSSLLVGSGTYVYSFGQAVASVGEANGDVGVLWCTTTGLRRVRSAPRRPG